MYWGLTMNQISYKNFIYIIQFIHLHKTLIFLVSSQPHFVEEVTEADKLSRTHYHQGARYSLNKVRLTRESIS